MAINWRELLPHYAAMLILYGLFVVALRELFAIDSFGASLVVALVVAFGYPQVARQFGFAPPSWEQ
jgi:hypothetical protein